MEKDKEGRGSILVVEDDRNLRNSLRLIFEKKDFDVETAGTGQEALQKVQERPFNVVLLDLGLPDRQGVELISPLKEIHPDMDVFVITGQATLETAVRALNEGASAYARKPLDMDDVLRRVWEFFEKQHLVLENRRLYQEAQREIEERKRVEDALRENEEKYRNLVEGSVQGVIVHTDEPLFVNKAASDIFGYDSPDDMLSLDNIDKILAPEFRPGIFEKREARYRGEDVANHYEFQGIRKDGSAIWVDTFVHVVNWDGRKAVQCTYTDITLRKRAEEALRESENRLHRFIDSAPAMLGYIDKCYCYRQVNLPLKELLDKAEEEIVGKTMIEVLGQETFKLVSPYIEEVLAGREASFDITRKIRARPVELHINYVPDFDEGGGVIGFYFSVLDITERKVAEQLLRESERRYRDLVNGSLQGILVHRGHKPLFVNDTFAKVYGYDSHTEIIDMTNIVDFLVAQQDRERIKLIGKSRLMGESPPAHYEFQGVKKDGTIFWLDSTNSVIQWENKSAILSTQIDVSERRSLEEQLRQSQKMEALGTLAGGIAHDFNNVLFPIIGFTDLLLKEAAPQSEEHEFLTTIMESAQRARDLVSQVMLFSRRGQTAKKVSDLGVVATEVAKLMRSTLPTSISVRVKISDGLDPVLCDPSQIHQVLLNLCVNAGQAMPDTGRLNITLKNVDAEGMECLYGKTLFGGHVRIAVTDTGVGMDEETLSHMFDPFFTTKGVGHGTGLGLSTVYGIVQEHEGGIVVESTPGRGTTIEVFLPVAQEEAEDVVSPGPPTPRGSETILFVDDEVAIVNLCRRVLEKEGYTVVTQSDGRKALRAFRKDPKRFDLVITDQTMPHMKGEALAAGIRQVKGEIPIILCTGHSPTMTPESSKAIGINAFLYKPVEPNQLITVVRQILDEAAETGV